MGYFALSTIKHNGNRYFRGDELPQIAKEQLDALLRLGVVSEERPDGAGPQESGAAPDTAPAESAPAAEPSEAAKPQRGGRSRRS